MTMTVYLAHPVSDYGTARQMQAIAAVAARGFKVENPDQPHHQVAYGERGMEHFCEVVADCDGLAFMRFPCGGLGAGVAKEIGAALRAGIPVWEILADELRPIGSMMPFPVMSIEDTRAAVQRHRAS
jgi:nucleoside 2-deoxyribosyltransferase